MARLEGKAQREQVIVAVLLIQHLGVGIHVGLGQVLVEVDKTWLNGSRRGVDNLLQERTLLVIVGRNGRDGGLIDLLYGRIGTLTLIYYHVVISQMTIRKGHNLLLGHAFHTTQNIDLILPFLLIDKRIDEFIGPRLVAEQGAVISQFHVVDYRRQQVVGKTALLQLLDLCQNKFFCVFQRLPLLGH